jgi:hypothetical protein
MTQEMSFSWKTMRKIASEDLGCKLKIAITISSMMYTALYRKLETNIPRNETARPRSQSNFYIHEFVSNLYISTIGSPTLLYCGCGPIKGIYIFITDTWMWCGNWERGRAVSFLGKFALKFLVQCICSVSPTHYCRSKNRQDGLKENFLLVWETDRSAKLKININCWCRGAFFPEKFDDGKGRTGGQFLLSLELKL